MIRLKKAIVWMVPFECMSTVMIWLKPALTISLATSLREMLPRFLILARLIWRSKLIKNVSNVSKNENQNVKSDVLSQQDKKCLMSINGKVENISKGSLNSPSHSMKIQIMGGK